MEKLTYLCENLSNFQNLQLRALFLVLALVNRVGDHYAVQIAGIDPLDGITAQYAVGHESPDKRGAFLLEQFCCTGDCVGGVSQVVNENGYFAFDLAD